MARLVALPMMRCPGSGSGGALRDVDAVVPLTAMTLPAPVPARGRAADRVAAACIIDTAITRVRRSLRCPSRRCRSGCLRSGCPPLRVDDVNPVARIAGDDVAGPGDASRRSCCRCRFSTVTPLPAIPLPIAGGAGDVGADVVALDDVARRRHSSRRRPGVARDHVPAAAVVPPIVLPEALVSSHTPTLTGSGKRLCRWHRCRSGSLRPRCRAAGIPDQDLARS